MKLKLWATIGFGSREEVIDTNDWGISDEEWEDMTEEEKYSFVGDWASNFYEYGFSENVE